MKKKDYILIIVVSLILIGSFFLPGKKENEDDLARWQHTYENTNLASGKINTIDYDYFEASTHVSKENIIIYVGSENCSWCQKFKPIFQEVVSEYNLKVLYIDVSTTSDAEYKKVMSMTGATGTPTTVIMNGSKVIDSLNGYNEKDAIINFFKTNGYIK